jgi:hypothetical protein
MDLEFSPRLSTTGIGSVPFTDSEEAVSFLLGADLSIPFWPQMPKRCFGEEMIPQDSKGMPCVRIDADRKKVALDMAGRMEEVEAFYHRFMEEDPSLFALSHDIASGLYAFEHLAHGRQWPVVKGQTTGPVTLCTSIYDEQDNPLFADPDLRDAVVKTIVRKVQWQIGRLKPFASDRVLMFVDEPVLSAFGSSTYIYLSEPDVQAMLGEVFEAITGAGGITAIHVCGNSDWGVIVRSGVQVINFDAYQYGTSISLYADDIKALFDRGGSIAWGIIPTTAALSKETTETLVQRLERCFEAMIRKGFSRELLRERAMLTPSCGTGSLSPHEAGRVFTLLREVRDRVLSQGKWI